MDIWSSDRQVVDMPTRWIKHQQVTMHAKDAKTSKSIKAKELQTQAHDEISLQQYLQ